MLRKKPHIGNWMTPCDIEKHQMKISCKNKCYLTSQEFFFCIKGNEMYT